MPAFETIPIGQHFWASGEEYEKTETIKWGRSISNARNVQSGTKARFGAVASVDLEKPTRRQQRYGRLMRGWDWRTEPDLLGRAEQARLKAGLTRTEFLEMAIQDLIEKLQ